VDHLPWYWPAKEGCLSRQRNISTDKNYVLLDNFHLRKGPKRATCFGDVPDAAGRCSRSMQLVDAAVVCCICCHGPARAGLTAVFSVHGIRIGGPYDILAQKDRALVRCPVHLHNINQGFLEGRAEGIRTSSLRLYASTRIFDHWQWHYGSLQIMYRCRVNSRTSLKNSLVPVALLTNFYRHSTRQTATVRRLPS